MRRSWSTAAEALAAAIPRERLDPAVLAWITSSRASRTAWHVALSGGADSVALLLLLWAHFPAERPRLAALHFDHRLRGRESAADARFCQALCRSLGVPCVVEKWSRPSGARAPSEAEARSARHAFFRRHARILWLGHHQDDVAETMLMRLARGSGTGGLAAPRPVQTFAGGPVYLRPMLGLSRAALRDALAAVGARWRDDRSNTGSAYFRNRVRQSVLPPWLVAAGRDAVAGAARSRQLLEEDDSALEQWVDRLQPVGKRGDLRLARLYRQPRAVVRRALHRWLLTLQPPVDLSRQAFDQLLAAVERGHPTRQSLGTERFAVISGGSLRAIGGKQKGKFQRRVN